MVDGRLCTRRRPLQAGLGVLCNVQRQPAFHTYVFVGIGNRHYFPHTAALVDPIWAKRFHRHYEHLRRATGAIQPALRNRGTTSYWTVVVVDSPHRVRVPPCAKRFQRRTMRTVLIEQLFFFQIFRFFFFQGKAEKLEKETGNISKVWKLNRGQNRRAKIFGWLRIPIFGGKKKRKTWKCKNLRKKKKLGI